MVQFKCPQCHADVIKGCSDPLGCPCCGYATQGVAPFRPCITRPHVDYDWPALKLTWTNDFTDLESSSTLKLSPNYATISTGGN